MSVIDLNDQLLGAFGDGMNAAAERFGQRMAEIRANRNEAKMSEIWEAYARKVAADHDALLGMNRVLRHQVGEFKEALKEKECQLAVNGIQLAMYVARSEKHQAYVDLLVKRLNKVEDKLERQSAVSHALGALKNQMIDEMRGIENSEKLSLLDPKKRGKVLDEAWNEYMASNTVKQGVPRLGIDAP